MSKPGAGRYTDYIGSVSPKNSRLFKLFNNNAMTTDKQQDLGDFYDIATSSDINLIAGKLSARYVATIVADNPSAVVKEPSKSSVYFNGSTIDQLPDTGTIDVAVLKDPPANPYMPDLNSPGNTTPGLVNLIRATLTPKDIVSKIYIDPETYKPLLVIPPSDITDRFNLGTVSPSVSSPIVGEISVGKNLTMGSSKKT